MDFVASRAAERHTGWRARISEFLAHHGATVFDPWFKPAVKGLGPYGDEDEKSTELREQLWSFSSGPAGARAREACAQQFYKTLHIDLRMVDLSDFVIGYVPSTIYSVGTVHEIALARQQSKPVLLVSPRIEVEEIDRMQLLAQRHSEIAQTWLDLTSKIHIRDNPTGAPSIWYMGLVRSECFFDHFGFAEHASRRRWKPNPTLDDRENNPRNKRALLPFLEGLVRGTIPRRYDGARRKFVPDDDWLLMDKARRPRQ